MGFLRQGNSLICTCEPAKRAYYNQVALSDRRVHMDDLGKNLASLNRGATRGEMLNS